MNTTAFLANFPRQLRHWTFHCTLNSAPSFFIALSALGLWGSQIAMVAMISAIITFILLYSTLTSFDGPLSDATHVLSRAFKLGTRIRAGISVLNLLLAYTPAMLVTPDFWCGFLAVGVTNFMMEMTGNPPVLDGIGGTQVSFFPIYLTTMIEGCILSGILFLISFIAVIWLQSRDRRKFFRTACPR